MSASRASVLAYAGVSIPVRAQVSRLIIASGGSAGGHLAAATLRLVMLGGTSFPPRNGGGRDAAHAPRDARPRRERANGAEHLTRREEEVLKYVGEGAQNKTIAFMLNMSENTVKVHLATIYRVLGVTNRTTALLRAQELGLVRER